MEELDIAYELKGYAARTGGLPERLSEVCPAARPCTAMSREPNSGAQDPWNRPYEYRRSGPSFELRSAGPDGIRLTADDIVYSPVRERMQVLRIGGCYRTDLVDLDRGAPRLLVLDTVPVRPGWREQRVWPSLEGEDGLWKMVGEDSVEVSWGRRRRYRMILAMGYARDTLRGDKLQLTEHRPQRLGRVKGSRVACELARAAGR
jgi:hypothetical protein